MVVVAVGVIGFGYWDTHVRPKGETVLKVGDQSYSFGYFERRVKYAVVQSDYYLPQDTQTLTSLLQVLVSQVGREELTRQGARELRISVTDQEIDNEIARQEEVPSGAAREEFLAAYRDAVRKSGLSTEDYRRVIEAGLLRDKVRQMFLENAPDTADQVRFRLIQVATEQEAQDVIARLDAGEDFGDLARELSLDTTSKEQGGEQDWVVPETLISQVREPLAQLEIGQRSEPIAVSQGFLVVEPLERAANRETTDVQKQAIADSDVAAWLDDLSNRLGVVNSMDSEQTNTLLEEWVNEARKAPSG